MTQLPVTGLSRLGAFIATLLFASRWLLAPIYLGLILALLLLLGRFAVSGWDLVLHGFDDTQGHFIVGVLGLVDLSLLANLIVIVMYAGYENFVSRLPLQGHADCPAWLAHVGFAEMKLKLMTSMVAVAAVHVLEAFMDVPQLKDRELAWPTGILVVFVLSGLLLALMDRISTGEKH